MHCRVTELSGIISGAEAFDPPSSLMEDVWRLKDSNNQARRGSIETDAKLRCNEDAVSLEGFWRLRLVETLNRVSRSRTRRPLSQTHTLSFDLLWRERQTTSTKETVSVWMSAFKPYDLC
jgi:hypothetical protein